MKLLIRITTAPIVMTGAFLLVGFITVVSTIAVLLRPLDQPLHTWIDQD